MSKVYYIQQSKVYFQDIAINYILLSFLLQYPKVPNYQQEAKYLFHIKTEAHVSSVESVLVFLPK